MITVSSLVFHSDVGAERLHASVFFIFYQKERQTQYACLFFLGKKRTGSIKQRTGYNQVIQQSPFTLIFIGTEVTVLGFSRQ